MSHQVAAEPQSDGQVRWGILATGRIAELFTTDLRQHGHRVTAVASRAGATAAAFAERHGIERAHPTYQDLMSDPDVDVVYVATPHISHATHAIAALEHGKHVLVEKAFTVNAAEARAVFEAARRNGRLAMEAMWTRFLPHMDFVRSVLAGGRLGDVRWLHADHTQLLSDDPAHRLNNPALAGGALLDLGVYPISFAYDVLGPPLEVSATGRLKDTGVDGSVGTVMRHAGGAVSTTFSASDAAGPTAAVVLGTKGRIEIQSPWYRPTSVTVSTSDGEVVERYDGAVSGRGMQYQAAEVEQLLAAGATESRTMSPEHTIGVMETMDAIRHTLGVRYPGE